MSQLFQCGSGGLLFPHAVTLVTRSGWLRVSVATSTTCLYMVPNSAGHKSMLSDQYNDEHIVHVLVSACLFYVCAAVLFSIWVILHDPVEQSSQSVCH